MGLNGYTMSEMAWDIVTWEWGLSTDSCWILWFSSTRAFHMARVNFLTTWYSQGCQTPLVVSRFYKLSNESHSTGESKSEVYPRFQARRHRVYLLMSIVMHVHGMKSLIDGSYFWRSFPSHGYPFGYEFCPATSVFKTLHWIPISQCSLCP